MAIGSEHGEAAAQLAESVRQACLQAALEAYEEAGLSGLCHEGRWECAVDAIRSLDLEAWAMAAADDDMEDNQP